MPVTETRPWAAYARISLEKDESVSIANQRAAVERWASAYGHRLVWFVDESVSASKAVKMPGRDRLEAGLAAGEFAGVVGKTVDRMVRSMADFVRLEATARATNARLVAVENGVDTGTSAGRMMMSMLAVFAQFEAEQMGARQMASQAERRRQGRAMGVPPYGFRHRHDQTGAWREIDPTEADAVRDMAAQVIGGSALTAVAAAATAAGYRPRRAAQWSPETVAQMLRNPSLNGQRRTGDDVERGPDGRPVRDDHLTILDAPTWRALQAALDERSLHRFGPASHGPLLLAHVTRCGSCDGPMVRSGASAGYAVYRCSNGGHKRCPQPVTIGVKKLEQYVDEQIAARPTVTFAQVVDTPWESFVDAEFAEIRETIRRTLSDMGSAAPSDIPFLAERLADLKSQEQVAVDRMVARKSVVEYEEIPVGKLWESNDFQGKRDLARKIFTRIVISPAKSRATPARERVTLKWWADDVAAS